MQQQQYTQTLGKRDAELLRSWNKNTNFGDRVSKRTLIKIHLKRNIIKHQKHQKVQKIEGVWSVWFIFCFCLGEGGLLIDKIAMSVED